MELRVHSSADEFRQIAEPLYRRDPVTHTIELTLLACDGFPKDSFLTTIWDDRVAVGAALQTPPYPLACNGIPLEAINLVVAGLAALRPDLDGVRGARGAAVAFASAWSGATGRETAFDTEERLYRLGTLRAPSGVCGVPRHAGEGDRKLLVQWVHWFFEDAFGQVRHDGGEEFVDNAYRVGHRFVLWEVDGAPVSVAMLRVPAAGVSRIGPVFTPRDRRRHGYGAAVTASAAQLAHRSGTPDVVLFADLANPTSNAIYQRIGFEPVADSVRINFLTLD
ncbi:MAG TPA: GNAT family N-acetyltransferase [Mycobacterium sp.]|nr:GNAT family N-acetyltransferase [Mycobacterium sp.]